MSNHQLAHQMDSGYRVHRDSSRTLHYKQRTLPQATEPTCCHLVLAWCLNHDSPLLLPATLRCLNNKS